MSTPATDALVGEGEAVPREASVTATAGLLGPDEEQWVEVATVKELVRHKKKYVEAGGEQIALFYTGEQVYALYDVCMHKQRSLSKGVIMGGQVICPGHQWMFDVETGWVDEEERCQPTYAVRVEDGAVYVNPVRRILRTDGD